MSRDEFEITDRDVAQQSSARRSVSGAFVACDLTQSKTNLGGTEHGLAHWPALVQTVSNPMHFSDRRLRVSEALARLSSKFRNAAHPPIRRPP